MGTNARKQVGKRRELERSGDFLVPILPMLLTCHNSYRFKIKTATAAMQTMMTMKLTVKPTIKPVFDDDLAVKPSKEKEMSTNLKNKLCINT